MAAALGGRINNADELVGTMLTYGCSDGAYVLNDDFYQIREKRELRPKKEPNGREDGMEEERRSKKLSTHMTKM